MQPPERHENKKRQPLFCKITAPLKTLSCKNKSTAQSLQKAFTKHQPYNQSHEEFNVSLDNCLVETDLTELLNE